MRIFLWLDILSCTSTSTLNKKVSLHVRHKYILSSRSVAFMIFKIKFSDQLLEHLHEKSSYTVHFPLGMLESDNRLAKDALDLPVAYICDKKYVL